VSHWARHPHVRTGKDLTFGERAADRLKATFGSWAFLIILNVLILGWIASNVLLPHASRWDIYPFILLNLGLSWLAAQQGGALQIAANRGDRIASEVAMGTFKNGEELLKLNDQIRQLIEQNTDLTAQVHALVAALPAKAPAARSAKTLAKEAS
jgi:uncharacterized membrane protein